MYQQCEKITLKRNETEVIGPSGIRMNTLLKGKFCFDVEGDGNGIILIIDNESASYADAVLHSSDNVFCGGNKYVSVPDNSFAYIHLEAAPYVQQSGEYKGKIIIEGSSQVAHFAVIEVL